MAKGSGEIPGHGSGVAVRNGAPSSVPRFRLLVPPAVAAQQGQDSVLFFPSHIQLPEKKPTWLSTRRCSATSAYSSMGSPACAESPFVQSSEDFESHYGWSRPQAISIDVSIAPPSTESKTLLRSRATFSGSSLINALGARCRTHDPHVSIPKKPQNRTGLRLSVIEQRQLGPGKPARRAFGLAGSGGGLPARLVILWMISSSLHNASACFAA